MKELFIKDDKIFICLAYSPKTTTLQKKFGDLPIDYIRMKLDNMEEMKSFNKIMKKYKFNLNDDEDSEPRQSKFTKFDPSASSSAPIKRKKKNVIEDDEEDEEIVFTQESQAFI